MTAHAERTMQAIGLMSGTSMDGVDVALIATDGAARVAFGPHGSFPYPAEDRALLRQALADAATLAVRDDRRGCLAAAEALVTRRHAEAVERFLSAEGIAKDEIDIVGFHGQTVLHRPERRLTVQIGDGAALASRLALPVVFDLRAADVAAGGQGAPLVPIYHRALVTRDRLEGPVAVINIGGVANVTLITGDADPIACDTGPGNALLDDLMLERTGEACDRDGVTAAGGTPDPAALDALLDHPFFARPAPKSADRNDFSRRAVAHLATPAAAATLVAFTAATIASTLRQIAAPALAVVCGGGGRNPTLMRELAARLSCRVTTADDIGWSVDAMEAQAFAYLAVRTLRGLPITFPGTTGIGAPTVGGKICRPGSRGD